MTIDAPGLDQMLSALDEQLAYVGARYEIVVVGGSALLALGLVARTTKDVDVVALAESEALTSADPLPEDLRAAALRVARDFRLEENWLNSGPASLLDLGLPEGFWDRVVARRFGPALTVHMASRLDQIHFKLFAMVDQGGGRHEADLRALQPTDEDLKAAAVWTTTHDPSPGFRRLLEQALAALGVEDVDLGP